MVRFHINVFHICSQSKAEEVKLSADLSQLLIGEESFTLGDMVVIFSVLSQESFTGIITAISHRLVFSTVI